jgi:enoyl-[acyl-carrier protein] reductase II
VRSLKSPFTTRYASIEKETLNDEDLHGLSAGALRKAAQEGDGENGQFMCGQIAGLVTREEPAAAIVADLMAGAEKVLGGAGQWVR